MVVLMMTQMFSGILLKICYLIMLVSDDIFLIAYDDIVHTEVISSLIMESIQGFNEVLKSNIKEPEASKTT